MRVSEREEEEGQCFLIMIICGNNRANAGSQLKRALDLCLIPTPWFCQSTVNESPILLIITGDGRLQVNAAKKKKNRDVERSKFLHFHHHSVFYSFSTRVCV